MEILKDLEMELPAPLEVLWTDKKQLPHGRFN
jgi:hypothetical protein